MGLGDVAGVFSRYFIVGFFLPSFFTLVAVSQAVTPDFLPTVYENASDGGRIAILGGAGALVGLVLLGLHHTVLRLFEGYPLRSRRDRWFAKYLYGLLHKRQKRRFDEARDAAAQVGLKPSEKRVEAWLLDLYFPHDEEGLLLPTSFGNAIRAFERHAVVRWGLNSISAWPRIEMLLPAEETQVHADAKGDLAFFVNGCLLAALAGLVLVADGLVNQPVEWYLAPLYAIPFIVSAAFYLASIEAAVNWGSAVRASIDIHRRELYDKVGLRMPVSFADEREVVAPALNEALLCGEPIPDQLSSGSRGSATKTSPHQ